MQYVAFSDRVLLPNKRDVLKVHLYFKLIQFDIKPFENDMDIILELYIFGGYNNPEEQTVFIDRCMEKGFKKSKQSLRNTLSKYVSLGVFNKPRNTVLHVNSKFLPNSKSDKLVLQHTISHAN